MVSNCFWSVVLMQVLFLLAYRRIDAFAMTFTPLAIGILFSFGVVLLGAQHSHAIDGDHGAMLAGLGIDYCIHYLSHYQTLRQIGLGPVDSADRTLREIGVPLVVAGLTSVHGFVAIAFAGIAALRDFALLGALGLGCSLIAAVTVLPAAAWGDRSPTRREVQRARAGREPPHRAAL